VLGHGDGPLVFHPAAASRSPGYDEPVTALRRWAADPLVPILAITLAFVGVACSPTLAPSASRSAPAASLEPSLTSVPGGPSSAPAASIVLPSTTETEFGRIRDALPPSFPRLPGQEPVDPGSGPTSGTFVVNMDAAAASAALAAALVALDWTVDVGSPLEDGSVVLEATHAPAGCKTEVRFTPLSGTVVMSVLYGASCPFG